MFVQVFDAESSDVRPLDKLHLARLNVSLQELKELIDPNNGLLGELMSCKCLSWRHREYVDVKTVASERNEQLLDILMRRSVADIKNFISCMERLDQQHAVKALKNGGGWYLLPQSSM